MKNKDILTFDTNEMDFLTHISKNTGLTTCTKDLIVDDETKMLVRVTRYPKGVMTPMHTHPCAHGMFVLKGTLNTNVGDFKEGGFVWFKEGSVATHGSNNDKDVDVLFITNKDFAIDYIK